MYAKSKKTDDLFIGFESVNETWTTLIWNGIPVPRYSISDHGRIYDHRDNRYLGYSLDKDGYFMASIYVENVGYKKIRVHRFELMSFEEMPEDKTITNHKDGNKQNLLLDNLEWTDSIGNTRDGWDMGLNNNRGVINGNGKHFDDEVHRICQLITSGLSNSQICDEFRIFDKIERSRFSATVSGIRYGKTHRYISNNYPFMNGAYESNRYSLDFAHLVCNFLSDSKRNYTYKEIMDLLQIPNEERANFRVYINDLLTGRTAKSVTECYTLKRPLEGNDELSYLMR